MITGTPAHPCFKDVKACLTTQHGCTWALEEFFKNSDASIGIFRRTTPDGRGLWATADYRDDEELEPETVQQFCRSLELELKDVHITNRDGAVVSVKPPPTRPPPPPAN